MATLRPGTWLLHSAYVIANQADLDGFHIWIEPVSAIAKFSNWLGGASCIFCFILKGLLVIERLYFDRLTRLIRSRNADVNNMCMERRSVYHAKQELDSVFSFISCFWFLLTFFKISLIILYFKEDKAHLAVMHPLLITLSLDCMFLALLIYLCDTYVVFKKNKVEAVRLEMMRHGTYKKFKLLITDIEEECGFRVFAVFTIDRKILFSFLAAVVNFSVLLIQMFANSKAEQAGASKLKNETFG